MAISEIGKVPISEYFYSAVWTPQGQEGAMPCPPYFDPTSTLLSHITHQIWQHRIEIM